VNAKVRAAVVRRSGGFCENCLAFVGEDGHADHFFGRAKAEETEANVWILCVACDHMKTLNKPNARVWLNRFTVHASLHGYTEAAKRAQDKLAVQVLKFG
jgi:5-methylcytosine-specific restriction endonuclease McrA